ncbi:restriction endonuclease subunit S [Nitrosomonas sp. Nm166]|uniref:restriction endonuclease subunit S n=1 Tax=Nitrosomonas sp. Nm166 TaxID=1881054 RepID=UPI0008E7A365|nr:restriction endonuclease subunit S [Nitrosomonas sp. Nm166]SFE02393.1 type I restriction enzyme, S subunit [Nitrosomonas sp. Nm166]
MTAVKKRGWVPKLRFPEFREAEGWEEHSLEALEEFGWLELGRGNVISAQDMNECLGPYPVYSSSIKNSGHMGSYGRFMFDEELISWSIDGGGDFFYRPKHKFSVTNVSGYMRLKADRLMYRFTAGQLQHLHRALTFDYQLKAHPSVIRKLYRLGVPTTAEQQKIADCLSSIDELITLEAQKLDTLKAHKQGLMQQLFPAEGETLPKLRFPKFRDAGEWEEKKAGTLFANRIEEGEDGLPIYSVTMNDGMVKRSSLDRKVDDIAESSGNKKAYKDDIAYNMMRMWQGAFGVSAEDCMVSPAYVVLAPEDKVCSDFFGYLFKLPKYLLLLTSHSQGLTLDRLRLYYKDFAQISLLIPTFLEQQKIADCLTTLDDLIAAQTQKLTALKTHKKGLMQQLFPALEEVKE